MVIVAFANVANACGCSRSKTAEATSVEAHHKADEKLRSKPDLIKRRSPVPPTRRRMLRPNAIKTLGKMLKRAGPGVHHQLGEASAKRVNFDGSDRLNRAQRFANGLPNQESTGQHCSETTQPEDDSSCNASGACVFSLSLLSAGSHLSCCDEPVVTQVAAWFQQSTESLQIFGAAHRQGGEGELPPLIGSHV